MPRPYGTGGGPAFHKNPNCKCIACTSRRRKEEAIALAAREGREPVVPKPVIKDGKINADLPPLIAEDRSARGRIAQWLAIRAAEPQLKNKDIAERMGIATNSLNTLIQKAVRDGWLKFDDPLSRIEHEVVPKVVDNLVTFLDAKDKTVTLETAKGTIFKTYQEVKGIQEVPQTVLALKIEASEPSTVKVAVGQIIGKPREKVEDESQS